MKQVIIELGKRYTPNQLARAGYRHVRFEENWREVFGRSMTERLLTELDNQGRYYTILGVYDICRSPHDSFLVPYDRTRKGKWRREE